MTTDSRRLLGRSLYTAADRFETDLAAYRGRWAPGSPADLEVRDEQFPGAWGERPTHDAHDSVLLHIHAVAEHLRSLGVMLEHSDAAIPLFTLARGVLDQSCGPWYRLASDISAEIRVQRFMNSQLSSFKELLNTMDGMRDAPPQAIQASSEANERITAITETAATYGWTVVPPNQPWKPPYLRVGTSEAPPSTTTLTKRILPDGGIGLLSWRLHSGVAHGEAYALASLLNVDESGVGPVEQTDRQAALRYAFAPLAYLTLLRTLYSRFGWDETLVDALEKEVLTPWYDVIGLEIPPQAAPAPQIPATFRP
ncbi:hypothetical protein [Streptomyces gardneri]|uniref:hypothetical protein n=1 Tax=Streptomyces gardneri TaxID=66892 RepID=UPI0036C0E701